jgi:pimeloyl-ACP methyl ester carboxylesterase
MRLEVITREPQKRLFATPLLFIHGTGHAAWCWDENFLPFFAERGFSAHAISLRGHGASEGREKLKWTRISDYVEDVRSVASRFQERVAVIGHSLGGLVAAKYLEDHEAAAGVLVAPSPSEGMFRSGLKIQLRHPLLMAKIALKQDYAVLFGSPRLAKKFLFSPDVDETEVEKFSSRFGRESYLAALEMIYNLPRPDRIKVPILIVGAENDAILSPAVIRKSATAFNADCRIFPNMAHDMMLEKGRLVVAEQIAGWLETRVN